MRTSILSLLLAGAMLITGRAPLAYGERKLELRSLKDRVYRLESGPINRCPEKLGFQLNAQANELLLYPMEVEWEEIRTHVSPVVIVRGLRQSWESPTEEVVDTGKSRSTYAAVLDRNRIEAVTLTRIEDSMLIESHAKLEFADAHLTLTRWSVSAGFPLSESLLCAYRQAPLLKTAQVLAH